MNGVPWWVTLLTSLGIPTILGSLFIFISGRLQARDQRQLQEKKDRELAAAAEEAETDDASNRDLAAMNRNRARMEAHVRWDYKLLGRMESYERIINELEVRAGLQPTVFPPIPDPPNLFANDTAPMGQPDPA